MVNLTSLQQIHEVQQSGTVEPDKVTQVILKDNEIVYADLDDNTNGDDSEDESNEEL